MGGRDREKGECASVCVYVCACLTSALYRLSYSKSKSLESY